MTEEQYENKAIKLLNSKVEGNVLGFTSDSGRVYRYDKEKREFGIVEPNGEIACFFRPGNNKREGMKYWENQVEQNKQ
ncbi:hypothetical protein FACS1894200_09060 [Spirochaetia bacterium]|nr:hypothetical protein FACS1894200_09060 [Spirochaetia bacterium]